MLSNDQIEIISIIEIIKTCIKIFEKKFLQKFTKITIDIVDYTILSRLYLEIRNYL